MFTYETVSQTLRSLSLGSMFNMAITSTCISSNTVVSISTIEWAFWVGAYLRLTELLCHLMISVASDFWFFVSVLPSLQELCPLSTVGSGLF